MARVRNGMFGRVSGKVGNVVLSRWKDLETMRSVGAFRKDAATEGQKIQRAKFQLVNNFVRSLKPLLQLTQEDFSRKMTGRNLVMKRLLLGAVRGTYPDISLDYSKVILTDGYEVANTDGLASVTVPGEIQFTWENENLHNAKDNDKAILVAYCPAKANCAFIVDGPLRSAETGKLDVSAFKGREVHTWLAFMSVKGKFSRSEYTGHVTVL